MSEIKAICLMCGKSYMLGEEDTDYQKLVSNTTSTYICEKCKHKVRFETQELNKPVKPI